MNKFILRLSGHPRARYAGVLALLSLSSLLIYSNVLSHGQFLFDDADYIVNNPTIQQLDSFQNITDPRYVGYLSFFFNYWVGGLEPFSFHLFNVLIHALNGFLVFSLTTLMVRIVDDGEANDDTAAAWRFMLPLAAALLFICHPLATQSVSYVTQRFTSLSAFFYLTAVVLYLAARSRFERLPQGNAAYLPYLASLAATVVAMKTKEISFTIPFMLLFLELILFSRSFFQWRRLVFLIPFILTLLIIPLSIYGPSLNLLPAGLPGAAEITRLDKIYDLEKRSRYEYFITQFRVVLIYLRLLVFPAGQRIIYDLAPSRTFWSIPVIASFLAIASLHLVAFASWFASSVARGRKAIERRLVAIGILWFFITISIESSLIPIKDLIFEHRTYLPSFGFLLVLSVYLLRLAAWVKPKADLRVKAAVAALALATAWGAATYHRNLIWTDELLFWQDAVEKAPKRALAYHNRGLAYSKLGRFEEALRDLDKTVSLFPANEMPGSSWENADLTRFNMSKTYANRAGIHEAMGDLAAAERDEARAREIFAVPDTTEADASPDAEFLTAQEYMRKGEHQKVVELLTRVLQGDPNNYATLLNRANAYSGLGRYDEALRDLDRVVAVKSDFPVAYYNRALLHYRQGRTEQGKEDLAKSCTLGFRPACEAIEYIRNNGGKIPGS